ncbi:unnamed protein product [Withania somnifera]
MDETPVKLDRRRSSTSSSGEVSVTVEKENGRNTGGGADVDSREAVGGSVTNGVVTDSSGTPVMELSRVNMSPREISTSDKSQSPSDHLRLGRSKTETPRHTSGFVQEAAKIFDNKISEQQKLKLLKRIATVKDDGTVEFEIPGDAESTSVLGTGSESVHTAVEDESLDATELQYFPPMQIVMLIVGTRGDVQPFTAIGKRLQDFGHRVRLATHANFKEFVLTAGLEFYPLGGDPKILAGYMVKNKGFLPSRPSEIPTQRNQLKEIIYSLLPACKEPDMDTGVPFKADAIIANPQHMEEKLKLRPVTYLSGSQGSELDIPHAYIWSPHLVPKPKDWGSKIDVVGFCFLDLATGYEPPESLVNWLEAGPKPIYIGFGSLPVQDPQKMTETIVKALEITGQRGIINKGWGGLGNLAEPKDFVYLLDNCPHDWLFFRCAAVVHHGGAGTTAAGLKAACPTTIVPFFGDQPFWGERVHARGVGPLPIPADQFTLDKLVDAIKFMLDPQVKERAIKLAKAMENEDGVTGAVKALFKQLPPPKTRACTIA